MFASYFNNLFSFLIFVSIFYFFNHLKYIFCNHYPIVYYMKILELVLLFAIYTVSHGGLFPYVFLILDY